MTGIHLACSRVQYRAAVNSELRIVNTLNIKETVNFLIRPLLKTDSHIITHDMYRSTTFKTTLSQMFGSEKYSTCTASFSST